MSRIESVAAVVPMVSCRPGLVCQQTSSGATGTCVRCMPLFTSGCTDPADGPIGAP